MGAATFSVVAAVAWTAIALLGATLLGTLYWVGSRIDELGSRIDGLGASLNARIDELSSRLTDLGASLGARIDAHVDRHAS